MQDGLESGSSGEGEGNLLACGPGSLGSAADQLGDSGQLPQILACFPIIKAGTVRVPALPPVRGQLVVTAVLPSGSFPGTPSLLQWPLGQRSPRGQEKTSVGPVLRKCLPQGMNVQLLEDESPRLGAS